MTVIEYMRQCGEYTVQVMISYNEKNLQVAKNEAIDGAYTVKEVADNGLC